MTDFGSRMKYSDLIQFDFVGEPDGSNLRESLRRLTRKTPAQQALVQEHLLKFFGGAGKELAELAELFPFHPEVIAVLEKIPFIPQPVMARILSAAAKRISQEPLPAN